MCSGARRSAGEGFTLVELLVAMLILVILTTLVLAAFQRDDTDRLSASARRVQSYLEGARSRAIKDQQVRGVRLLLSDDDPRTVTSLVYVGSSEYLEGTVTIAFDPSGYWLVVNSTAGEWARLNVAGRNLIVPGLRIELPAGTGNWYTIVAGPGFNPFLGALQLGGHYTPSTWDAASSTYIAQPATSVRYRLQLAAPILTDKDPVQLDRGIVIDLDASRIPSVWRPDPPATTSYSAAMDILFDARGNPTGELVANGLIHLYLTTAADVELSRSRATLPAIHPANPPAPPATDSRYPFTSENPQTDPRIITLFTQTGQVVVTQALLIDTNSDQRADVPALYRYAQRGKEAK